MTDSDLHRSDPGELPELPPLDSTDLTQLTPVTEPAQPGPDQPDPYATQLVPALSGGWRVLLVPLLVGGLVAVTLGVYANVHEPTGIAINLAGFSGPLEAKVWLATGAVFFALLQLASALVMYGKVPRVTPPDWIGTAHTWSGRVAFLLSVPVAIHCLYAVGFSTGDTRAMVHSVLGVVLYGAFVAKLLGLRKDGLPGWFLPVLGSTVFSALVGLWWTSSLWYFTTFGVQF